MADTITSSKSLAIGIEFDDAGTKRTSTVTLPNYRSTITESQIKNIFASQNVLIYGYDDNENPLPVTSDNVLTASTTNQTINNIDIGWE